MPTEDFIAELFCRVDDGMREVPKHSQASPYPSEIVTLGLLFAIKGVGNRAYYRWIERDCSSLFPCLPERTRLFRPFAAHRDWSDRSLADPTTLGIADSYGIELVHPIREGRSEAQIGREGKSDYRWIVGGKLRFVLNQRGQIVGWDAATANVHDATFHPLIERLIGESVVLTDSGFHSRDGDPANMKICKRGTWNARMVVEAVLSMLTVVCHLEHLSHRAWPCLRARLAWAIAACNILIGWHTPKPDQRGRLHPSIAEFSP
jgi:hypothetical protein